MVELTERAIAELRTRLTAKKLSILGITEGGWSYTVRFTLVQGEVEGVDRCFTKDGIEVCVDHETQQISDGKIHVDYVPSQGFRLYTDSEFLATHLRIQDHIAEV